MKLTYCIMNIDRPISLVKTVVSAIQATPAFVETSFIILQQGEPSFFTKQCLTALNLNRNINVIFNKTNIGAARGRNLLLEVVETEYCCTLDNDIHIKSLGKTLSLLEDYYAVGLPLFNPSGKMVSEGGVNIMVVNGILHVFSQDLNPYLINGVNSGCMFMKTELRDRFRYDPFYLVGFEDLDKTMQLQDVSQAIATDGKAIHDHKENTPNYFSLRWNGVRLCSEYKHFCKAWGVKLPRGRHLSYSYLYPLLMRNPTSKKDLKQVKRISRVLSRLFG